LSLRSYHILLSLNKLRLKRVVFFVQSGDLLVVLCKFLDLGKHLPKAVRFAFGVILGGPSRVFLLPLACSMRALDLTEPVAVLALVGAASCSSDCRPLVIFGLGTERLSTWDSLLLFEFNMFLL
jgi:hypothetical protein